MQMRGAVLGVPAVTQGRNEPECLLKPTYRRTPVDSGGGTTRQGLGEYSQGILF